MGGSMGWKLADRIFTSSAQAIMGMMSMSTRSTISKSITMRVSPFYNIPH